MSRPPRSRRAQTLDRQRTESCWFHLASAVQANVGGRSRERRKRVPGAALDYARRALPKTTLVPRIWVHKPSACGVNPRLTMPSGGARAFTPGIGAALSADRSDAR